MTATSERATGRSSVAQTLQDAWPALVDLRTADPATLWSTLVRSGTAVPTSVSELVDAMRALGAAAAPAPVADAWAADQLLSIDEDLRSGNTAVALATAAAASTGTVAAVEFGAVVTHVVVVDPTSGLVRLHRVAGVTETPGSAVPAWSRITLGEVERQAQVDPARIDRVLSRVRLALAVRALAGAEHTHQLAIEHAKARVQFGQPVGSYQAVQHRTVNCAVEVALGRGLADDAVRLDAAGDATAGLAVEMAVEHALDRASWVQFEAHHTLAASGFFDLYPGPWLFRRVHSDLARIPLFPRAAGTVADEMIDSGTSFPTLRLGEEAEALRERLRRDFDTWQPAIASGRQAEVVEAAVRGVVEQGLVTFGWPTEYGGAAAGVEEQAVLAEEVGWKRLAAGGVLGAGTMLGNSIIAFGSEAQKAKFLPLIARGELNFYLGYSEPEVGSDLASVQLRAERDGNEWVLNGTKRWGQAQRADWGWIAARTDPDAQPRHAGISVFLIDLRGLEGFRIEEITSLAGETHAFSHYEDVRIPADALVGELNGGWKVITNALAEERITMAGIASGTRGLLDVLLRELRERADLPAAGSQERARLGRVATRLQGARILTLSSLVAQTSEGTAGRLQAPLAKIVSGESTEEFSKLAVDLLGPEALLDGDAEGSVAGGHFDYSLRVCLIGTVGGGTGDIQRNLVARALGLPRG